MQGFTFSISEDKLQIGDLSVRKLKKYTGSTWIIILPSDTVESKIFKFDPVKIAERQIRSLLRRHTVVKIIISASYAALLWIGGILTKKDCIESPGNPNILENSISLTNCSIFSQKVEILITKDELHKVATMKGIGEGNTVLAQHEISLSEIKESVFF